MSRKLLVLTALISLTFYGQSQAVTVETAKSNGTFDMTQTTSWTTSIVPNSTAYEANFTGGNTTSTYTLSSDMATGNFQVGNGTNQTINVTFDLGAARTWTVGGGGSGTYNNIGGYNSGSAFVATVTVKSGTLTLTGADGFAVGWTTRTRVAGTLEDNFIIDGGTVNFNSTSSNPGSVINKSGLLWVKSGSTLNTGGSSRLFVGGNRGASDPYLGTLQVDGTVNVANKLNFGQAYQGGTTLLSGTINLTAGAGNTQVTFYPGSKVSLSGGSIVATTHQTLGTTNNTNDLPGSQTNPGLLIGNGILNNLDVAFTNTTAGQFKLAPGTATAGGTIEIQSGNFTESNGQIIALDLGSTSNDKLLVSTTGKSASILNGITYSALDSLATASGDFDMVVAPSITYGGTALSTIGSDVPAVTGDNLVTLLTGLGYTRVTGTAPGANEFRYYVGDAGNGLKAIRVELAPEPATLSVLVLGGLVMLKRKW